MKKVLLLCFISLTSLSFGQITITQSDFPAADDTVMVSISDDTGLDLNTTGANTIWDFSTLNVTAQRIDTFYGIWGAPLLYQAVYNNFITDPDYVADFYSNTEFGIAGVPGLNIEGPKKFTKVTSSSVENLGLGLNINGIDVPAKADTIDIQYELPINYSDSWISNYYLNLDLNPAIDGIYRRYMQRNSIVDGWGTITTSYGTYDVIRVKSFLNYTDSMYVDFGFGGTWFELPTPDQIEYTWITNGQKIPILTVVTDDDGSGGEIVTKVEFKDKDLGLLGTEEITVSKFDVYPNPANNQITVKLDASNTDLKIYNALGEIVYSNIENDSQVNIDVSKWERGIYFVQIIHDSKVSSSKIVLN